MSGELDWPTVTEVILQVPNPAGRIPGGFSFVHVKVTSEDMPPSAFKADVITHLRGALAVSLAVPADPESYGPWLDSCWPPEVLAACREVLTEGAAGAGLPVDPSAWLGGQP